MHGESYDVGAARCSIIIRELAAGFHHSRIAAVKTAAEAAASKGTPWTAEELEQRIQSAKNSAKSFLTQARAIFAADLLQSAHYSHLTLPDVSGIKKYKIGGGTTISAFVAPPTEVWQKIKADLPTLRTEGPDTWLAFQVGANSGLRRSSAKNARWDWCVENTDGSAAMRVGRAKGSNYTMTIAPEVWAEMKAARASVEYIIPGEYELSKARNAPRKAGKSVDAAIPT